MIRLFATTGVLIFVAVQPAFTHGQIAYASPTVSITNPSGTVQKGEDLDYATHDWHDAWDMNQESDLYFDTSPTCNSVSNPYSSISFAPDGTGNYLFSANQNGQPDRPWLWLIQPGYPGSLHVGKDGNVHRIDASKYTQLTFRMWMNATPTNGTHLIWTNTDHSGLQNAANYGLTYYFRGYSGWAIYTIDLTQAPLVPGGTLSWSGNITGLGLFTGDTGVTQIKIDWVRLTPKPNRTVQWSGTWQSTATAQLYFSTDNVNFDPLYSYTSGGCCTLQPNSISAGSNGISGSYQVPASFPAGPQYVKVNISDGTGNKTSSSAGPWQFNAMPDLTFVAPSYTSGDDFATKVVGNPWDMSDSADVASTVNTTTPSFSNGIMTASSINGPGNCTPPWGDPEVYLNMGGHSLDTSYYRYATIKLKIDRSFDFGNGWVARWFWDNNSGYGYGNDMPLYQNPVAQSYWNLFNVDMWGNVQDDQAPGTLPWQSGSPTRFRIDPHEIPPNTSFEIDDVKLTSNDNAPHNGVFTIKYLLNSSYNATFYYSAPNDQTCNSATRHLANPFSPSPPSGPFKLFFPLLVNNSTGQIDPPGTRIYYWSLGGITGNQYYYVCADVNDSYYTTRWVSDTPLYIKP